MQPLIIMCNITWFVIFIRYLFAVIILIPFVTGNWNQSDSKIFQFSEMLHDILADFYSTIANFPRIFSSSNPFSSFYGINPRFSAVINITVKFMLPSRFFLFSRKVLVLILYCAFL